MQRTPGQQAAGETHGGAAVAAVEHVGRFLEPVEAATIDQQFVPIHLNLRAQCLYQGSAGARVRAQARTPQARAPGCLGAQQQTAVGDRLVAGHGQLAAQAARGFDHAGARRGGGVDHAPTSAPTRRPRAAAIGSNCAINSLKCLKLRLC